jgi:O-antigen ligase
VTCVSVVNSINPQETLRGGILRLLQYIFVIFALTGELKDSKHVRLIIASAACGLIFSSFDAIWQVITGHDFVRGYETIVNIGLKRATASFKDSNTFGVYLSALIPLVIGLSLYYFKGKKKLVFFLIVIISIIGIALTYSRPTLLALYIVFFFLALVRKNNIFIVFLIAMILLSPFLAPKAVKDWAKEVGYNPLRFMCNDDRIAVYRNSLLMIKAHPVIGVGANSFMKSYKYYKEFPEYRNVVTLDEMKAHNNFLQMAGEIGLVGFSIFIWLMVLLFYQGARIYAGLKDNFLKIVALSLIACLISFLVNGLTESSLYYSRVALIFWYLAGFLLALNKFVPKEPENE